MPLCLLADRCFVGRFVYLVKKCYTFVAHHYTTLTMNLVSRKMVIRECKDRFLVRRKYGSGQFRRRIHVESGLC